MLSPSSGIYDRDFKRDAYLALGVSEVWLVDPDDQAVHISSSSQGTAVARDRLAWRPPTPGALELSPDLGAVFRGFARGRYNLGYAALGDRLLQPCADGSWSS